MLNKVEEILNINEYNIIKKSIVTINTTISNVLSSLSTIESDITDLQNADTNIISDIADIQSDITSLQNSDVSINNSITSINNNITSINSLISTIQSDLTALEAEVDGLSASIGAKFKIVGYTGSINGVNTTFTLLSHVEDIAVFLNGLELVENVHYNYNIYTDIVTIIDLTSIPVTGDYFIIKENY